MTKESIVIIGSGFSAAMCAYHLLEKQNDNFNIILIAGEPKIGRGIAYSTPFACHLLNVPAAKMSALPDKPNHFLDWVNNNVTPTKPTDFVSRSVYGTYIEELFQKTTKKADNEKFQIINTSAIDITPSGKEFIIDLDNNSQIHASQVILALGHGQGKKIPGLKLNSEEETKFIVSSWDHAGMSKIEPSEDILLVGTGLTMLDAVIYLTEQGHTGKITAISRRGQIPASHAKDLDLSKSISYTENFNDNCTLTYLFKKIRDLINKQGLDFRLVIDCLRPKTAQIWQNLSQAEKKRFLRHLVPYWDIVRHRAAHHIREKIDNLIEAKKFAVIAGRVQSIQTENGILSVNFKRRLAQQSENQKFDKIINCLGPETNIKAWSSQLMKNLLEKKLVTPDELGIGIKSTTNGQVLNNNGQPLAGLYLIGPARKADLWESVAVPELRNQAYELVQLITCSNY